MDDIYINERDKAISGQDTGWDTTRTVQDSGQDSQIDVSKFHQVQKDISPKDTGIDAHNDYVRRGLENGSLTYHNGSLVHVDKEGNIR